MASKSVAVAESNTAVAKAAPLLESKSLVARMAHRYGVDSDKFLSTIKATCFKGNGKTEVSNEQLMALLVVAEQFGLNIWLKELHAFPNQDGGITPIIGVDGFIKIANSHPQFAGMSFDYDDDGEWVECIIERKDRSQPTRIREYMAECKRSTAPWSQWPKRMLRHRALCQAVRVAFGFSLMEADEADAWIEGQVKDVTPATKPKTLPPRAKQIAQPEPIGGTATGETSLGNDLFGKPPTITLDQAIVIKDRLSAEGLAVSLFAATFEIGAVEDLPAARYDEALKAIEELSAK